MNDKVRMTKNNNKKDKKNEKPYDLQERTPAFGEAIIEFARKVPVNPVTRRLIEQLVRAGYDGLLDNVAPVYDGLSSAHRAVLHPQAGARDSDFPPHFKVDLPQA